MMQRTICEDDQLITCYFMRTTSIHTPASLNDDQSPQSKAATSFTAMPNKGVEVEKRLSDILTISFIVLHCALLPHVSVVDDVST